MINTKYLLYISTCLLISGNVQAFDFKLTYDSSDIFSHGSALHIQIHTPYELKPISIFNPDNAVKLAAVCSVGGGGCSGLSFGSSGNSMNLDEDFQCTDEGFVKTCPSGYVKDDNNLCPHNKSYFKCRPCNSSCDSGYSLTSCNSTTQVQTASYKTECGSTCHQCRDKTCAEGGYTASITSCQNGTAVSFANKTCYKDVSTKTCENGGYKSSIPTNNKCDSTTYCSKTCYTNCKQPTCEESGFLSTCPTNHTCTQKTSYGRTCYVDGGQPTCEDGGYKSGVPTNQVCTPVSYSGRTCYQNCYQPQCAAGGYLDACPANQSGTSVTYYGRNCVKDCKVNETEIACTIGSVLYEDKKCYSSTTKTPIAIVFDTEDHLAVALEKSSSVIWGGDGTDISSLEDCLNKDTLASCSIDGKANTAAIIAFGKENNISYPAAEYCNKYTTTGTSAGEWFLPSFAELKSIYNNRTAINTALNGLGKSSLSGSYSWSSNEKLSSFAWGLYMPSGTTNLGPKTGSYDVHPVIQYGASSETEIECKFGSILYKDLKCYSKTKKTPIGVVIDNTNKRAIALDETRITSTIQDLVNADYSTTYGNAIGVPGWDWPTTNDLSLMKENVDALNLFLSTISGAKLLDKDNDGYVGGEPAIVGGNDTERVNRCLRDANVDSSGNITKFCLISVGSTADLSSMDHRVRLVLFYGDCGSYQTSTNGQKCTSVIYNGNTCYKDCRAYTCSDGGYQSSNKFLCTNGTLTSVSYKGLTCYHCVGTSTPTLAKDCSTAGSQYFNSIDESACKCPYGALSETVTTSSGKKACLRCGSAAECGNSGFGYKCLQCVDKMVPENDVL